MSDNMRKSQYLTELMYLDQLDINDTILIFCLNL